MNSLTEQQVALAKKLMADNNEKKIYVKKENGHMYFDKQNALASVGNDESKLELIEAEGKKAEGGTGGGADEKPAKTWTLEKLKGYATEKSIDLGEATKKDEILAAIVKAETPA
jgi:hypothetical protein